MVIYWVVVHQNVREAYFCFVIGGGLIRRRRGEVGGLGVDAAHGHRHGATAVVVLVWHLRSDTERQVEMR